MNIRTSKDTKLAARQALSNNWGNAVLVTIIIIAITGAASAVYYFINFILNFITAAVAIIGTSSFGSFFYRGADFFDYFTTSPALEGAVSGLGATTAIALAIISVIIFIISYLFLLAVGANLSVGAAKYHLNLVSGNSAKISDVFFSFKACPLKSLWVTLLVSLKTLLWGIWALVPALVCFVLSTYFLRVGYPVYIGAILSFSAIALYIVSIILMIYASYRYCLAYFVLARNPALGVREAVRLSKETINGYKSDRFMLDISFIGWYLLLALAGVISCGIGTFVGALFLSPYFYAAQAVQFCDITGTPTIRHDFTGNPYQNYQGYQAYQGFQNNTYNNQEGSGQGNDNSQNPQASTYPAQTNEDIKEDSGENKSEE